MFKICYNGDIPRNIYLTPAAVAVPFSNIHFWCPVFPYKIFSLFCFPCKWILIFPYITTVLVDFPVAVNITTFTKRVANTNEMSKACVMVMFYTHIKVTLTFTMLITYKVQFYLLICIRSIGKNIHKLIEDFIWDTWLFIAIYKIVNETIRKGREKKFVQSNWRKARKSVFLDK